MDLRWIFINNFGRLRSGWRVTLYFLGVIAAAIIITTAIRIPYALLHYVIPASSFAGYLQEIIFRLGLLASALIPGYLCLKLLEQLPWRALGLTLHAHWLVHLLIGSAIGIVTLAVAVAVAYAGGGLKFSLNSATTGVVRSLLSSIPLFIIAALAERAMFTGYPLQTLTRAHLAWLGVLLTSVPFSLVHLTNPNVVLGPTFVNTALAGVWLAVAFLRTRSLWFPLGVHWSWNWAQGSLFGLPVSGMKLISNPLLQATDVGPAWLTGGSYGPEAGIAATLALIVSTLFIWRTKLVSATPEMLRLTSQENPATTS